LNEGAVFVSDHFAEMVRIVVPAVIIPGAVFTGNWAFRYREQYTQTAASDFLLALLIFDGAVVTTAKDFEPFIHDPELRQIVVQWHVVLGILAIGLWWLIIKYGEPVVASYYRHGDPGVIAFFATLSVCWVAVFMLVSVHIGFFSWR
jgi:hypothetical protein